jgi:hypothetical protein|tara:strand:+ start:287 stop:445 length:159 start_codon:yes stop_codon:yes gene_type:complete
VTKLKEGIRKSLEPEIIELLESEPVVKLGKEFPGARIVYAKRLKHQKERHDR